MRRARAWHKSGEIDAVGHQFDLLGRHAESVDQILPGEPADRHNTVRCGKRAPPSLAAFVVPGARADFLAMDVDQRFQPEQVPARTRQPAAGNQFANAQDGDFLGPDNTVNAAQDRYTDHQIRRCPSDALQNTGILRQKKRAQKPDAMHLERRPPVEFAPALDRPTVAIILLRR